MTRQSLTSLGIATAVLIAATATASNHREAPITALDHKADITDVFAFRSYSRFQESGSNKVTLILCVDPLLEPSNGPTLFPFDPDILYQLHVDSNHDAIEDISFEFRFNTDFRLPDVYTSVAGFGDNGAFKPGTNIQVVPPQIRDFANPGLNLAQTYTVTMVSGGQRFPITQDNGSPFFAVPGNAGPRTMDYGALFKQATYQLPTGISVFAGTVDDPFWIDLGATFDTANFRTLGSGVPGVLTSSEDSSDKNFASDSVSGFAVNTIAIELPIEMLTSTGRIELPESPAATLGIWGTTSRQRLTIRRSPEPAKNFGEWRQVQRLGNPLINELLIGIGSKDRFSMDRPRNDEQFASFFLNPPIVGIVEALYGGALAVPTAPRLDLLPLVTYAPPIAAPKTPAGPIADMLRLNTGIRPTPERDIKRLGLLAGDPAGFPNGRRPMDDVVDITLRVAVGGVLDPTFKGYQPGVNDRLGDGVNVNDAPYRAEFPYVANAPDGRNRRHIDPSEVGGGPRD